MKKVVLILLISVVSLSVYAVSLTWKSLSAVSISALNTETYVVGDGAGVTTESTVEFRGPELSFLMKLLPPAINLESEDKDQELDYLRVLEVNDENSGRTIQIECASKEFFEDELRDVNDSVSCSIKFIEGERAG